jgi:DNA-binding NtrC family response regulator
MVERGVRILIVDDEDAIRALVKCALSGPGRQIFDANCAKAAIALADAHGPFDLLVSDIIMPGMDGIDLACALHSRGNASAFLLISGYCDGPELRRRMEGIEGCEFLSKPFTVPELVRVVRGILPQMPVRAAAVHEHRPRHGLRGARTPADRMTALRRLAARLARERELLIAEAEDSSRRSRWIYSQLGRQYELLCKTQVKLEHHQAMVKYCFGILGDR